MTAAATRAPDALTSLLQGFSAELTARDKKSLEAAATSLPKGTEVFIAAIPGESVDRLVAAAAQLKDVGMAPVPHIVARNIASRADLDTLLGRMVGEAGVDRVLVLGGDRDKPEGEYDSAMQLLRTGAIQARGLKKIFVSCYPEGHPRIADEVLEQARAEKLRFAAEEGLDVTLVSQFCFDAEPIIALTRRMRALGQSAPYRVGVAGPADRGKLIKYALMCGVGASLRALKERQDLARSVLAGETPFALLDEVARAVQADPALGICGVHFFTFGDLGASARWAQNPD